MYHNCKKKMSRKNNQIKKNSFKSSLKLPKIFGSISMTKISQKSKAIISFQINWQKVEFRKESNDEIVKSNDLARKALSLLVKRIIC